MKRIVSWGFMLAATAALAVFFLDLAPQGRAEVGAATPSNGSMLATGFYPLGASEQIIAVVDADQHVLAAYWPDANNRMILIALRHYGWDMTLSNYPPEGMRRGTEHSSWDIKEFYEKAQEAKNQPANEPGGSAGETILLTRNNRNNPTQVDEEVWIVDNTGNKKLLRYKLDWGKGKWVLLSGREVQYDLQAAKVRLAGGKDFENNSRRFYSKGDLEELVKKAQEQEKRR